MKRKLKNIFTAVILSAVFIIQPLCINTIFAASDSLLYENKDTQTITSGVTYEKSSRLYKEGWMDIYVLTVDVTNPNVDIGVISSVSELGLKQTVEKLANDNDVVAAVNGDFFGSGNPMSSMGQVFNNGELEAGQNYYNSSENKYAGFFIDKDSNAFIDYVKTTMGFYNSSEPVVELQAKNKITNFSKPVYFDKTVMDTTAQIDNRYSNLYKIVVENNIIKDISGAGETVTVPENGYIIVMNSSTAVEKLEYFSIGQKVSFTENNTFLFRPQKQTSEIKFGISGGGEILRNGEIISNGLIIGENIRNPRTLIGVTQDKKKIIIMAIDGRRNGIGATHTEAAYLMKEYGAYDAIHLDGGGSTTVVAREENTRGNKVLNVPSEGSLRAVANGVGIKSVGKSNGLSSINLKIKDNDDRKLLANVEYEILAYGYDQNHNPVDIDINNIQFSQEGINGKWNSNKFTPESEGKFTITAKLGEVVSKIEANAISGAATLNVYAGTKVLSIGESTQLSASIINKDGYAADVNTDEVQWKVENPELGYIENGMFVARADGFAIVTGTVNGVSASVTIGIGKAVSYITSFEEARQLVMHYYPEDSGISGGAGITNASSNSGERSLLLSYSFIPNLATTQVTYVSFETQPIELIDNATDICMWIKGDKSGNLLKMVIKDADNNEYISTLSESMDTDQWQYVTTAVPEGVAYPIRIEKIYVAALNTNSNNTIGTVYIDDISQLSPKKAVEDKVNLFKDYLNIDLSNSAPSSGQEDITIFGQTAAKKSDISNSVLQTALSKMQQNARAMLFVGLTDSNISSDVATVKWDNKYITTQTNNFSIINLATHNGSIRTSSPDQWRWFQNYLNDFSKNNIIINMDKNIFDYNYGLKDDKESELFHKILKDFISKTGKNVLVVSATGYNTNVIVKDAVRYININGLSSLDPENINSYKYLRVRGDADNMYYDIQNVY